MMACRNLIAAMALAAAFPVMSSASAERGRRGRVVRVERSRRTPGEDVHLCMFEQMSAHEAGRVWCFGTPPRPGARLGLVDEIGYIGSGRVTHVQHGLPPSMNLCSDEVHTIQFEWTQTPDREPAGNAATVIGLELDPRRAKLMSPEQPPPGVNPDVFRIGVDADGDTTAEVMLLVDQCGVGAFCLETWRRTASGWKQVSKVTLRSC